MLIELPNGTAIEPGTFTALIAPPAIAIAMINGTTDLRRYLFLYVSGNFSRILTHIDRNAAAFDTRRAFTAHQLVTILNEAEHTVLFVEHDPTLFDGAWNMVAPIAQALEQVGCGATVILYAPSADRSFSLIARNARNVICFLQEARPSGLAGSARAGKVLQTVLETGGIEKSGVTGLQSESC